jgi:sulfur relay (sulfurtransferase) DsrC/TusE family protein
MADEAPAANATAEHEAAGETFEQALEAAMADDSADGTTPVEETAPEPTAKPEGEKPEDDAEELGEDGKPKAKVEAKPKDKAEEETPDAKKLRAGFTALARDRAKLRDREAAAVQLEKNAQQYQGKAQLLDTVLSRMDTDPVGLLRERGGDALINKLLDDIVAQEKSPAEREVAKLRAEREEEKRQAQEREQLATVDRWKQNVAASVRADERFDLVNALGQHDAVVEAITQYYQKYNGAVLPVETAAQAVEDALAAGLAKSKKFGARAPSPNAQPSKGTPAPSGRKPGATSLSGVHASELPPSEDDLPLDDPHARFQKLMSQLG